MILTGCRRWGWGDSKTPNRSVTIVLSNCAMVPPKILPRIKSAPRVRQVFWCDFAKDAQLPEFWKSRPVVVISRRTKLFGKVTIVPITSQSQGNNKMAFAMKSPIDGRDCWVICDHPMTIAVSRLSSPRQGVLRLREDDFELILRRVIENLKGSSD